MKFYCYGSPSRTIVKLLIKVRSKNPRWLGPPCGMVLVVIWALLVPPAWLLVQAGEIGHTVGGWCGFNTREW